MGFGFLTCKILIGSAEWVSCVVWHFIHQGTDSYCLYLARSTEVQEGHEYLLKAQHLHNKGLGVNIHPQNWKEDRVCLSGHYMENGQEGCFLDHGDELCIVQKQGDILNPIKWRTVAEFISIIWEMVMPCIQAVAQEYGIGYVISKLDSWVIIMHRKQKRVRTHGSWCVSPEVTCSLS